MKPGGCAGDRAGDFPEILIVVVSRSDASSGTGSDLNRVWVIRGMR